MGWFEKIINVTSTTAGLDLVRSILLIMSLIILRYFILRILNRASPNLSLEDKRRWAISLRNTVIFCSLFGLILIWARELQSFALSIVAFAAALVLATKEIIMCISGGFLRAASNSYTLGDHIQVNTNQGRVIDINLFTTTLVELGPDHLSHRMTGKIIKFPNSLLLSFPVIKDNDLNGFILCTFTIPVPYHVDPVKAEHVILAATNKYALPYLDEARGSINIQEIEKMLDTPSLEPRISMTPVDDKQYKFVIRIAIPKTQRNRIEQEIYRIFLIECYGQSTPNESF
ncbi:mechanosensitive ion channel domain-containing protein [Neisseria sp. Ec49-e6-T10]|uniref:mechanosensitive ion channel domain-containing protein n=1 Tax=Neisseria sp. Ec49-e6-T10 TaxID=3140744 RepID=UPI003EC0CD2C